MLITLLLLYYGRRHRRVLHSLPTRRSSDLSPSASASGSDNGTAGPAEGGTGGLAGGVVVVIMGSKQGRRTSIRDQPTRPLHHTTPQATHWGQAPTGEERRSPARLTAPARRWRSRSEEH